MDEHIAVFAFGNPILDTFVELENREEEISLIQNKLQLQLHLPQEADLTWLRNISELSSSKSSSLKPGGCALTTCRILRSSFDVFNSNCHVNVSQQNSRRIKNLCINYFGSVGEDDKEGRLLTDLCQKAGVNMRLSKKSNAKTAQSIAFIYKSERTLVADLGAALLYDINDYETNFRDGYTRINDYKYDRTFIFLEAYFAHHSWPVVNQLFIDLEQEDQYERVPKTPVTVIINLCGEYIFKDKKFQNLASKLAELILRPHRSSRIHQVVCNRSELEAFVQSCLEECSEEDESGVSQLVKVLHDDVLKVDGHRETKTTEQPNLDDDVFKEQHCLFIVTDGPDNITTFFVKNSGDSTKCRVLHIQQHEVPKINRLEMNNTVGAGDAFSAGLLLGVMENMSLNKCIQLAIQTAQNNITSNSAEVFSSKVSKLFRNIIL